MKARHPSLISAAALVAVLCAPLAQAGTVQAFTDRAAFEHALTGLSVDGFDDVTPAFHDGLIARPGYVYSTVSSYGCVDDCGGAPASSWNNAYLWNYAPPNVFTFSRAVHGFGFDFSAPNSFNEVSAIIDGRQAATTFGFFGLLYSDARTSFTVSQSASYMLMDNVTAGSVTEVPEPSTLGLLGIAAFALAWVWRRKRLA